MKIHMTFLMRGVRPARDPHSRVALAVPEPAVSGPAIAERAVAERAVAGPAVSGPAVAGPAVSGPAVSGPVAPGAAKPAMAELAAAEHVAPPAASAGGTADVIPPTAARIVAIASDRPIRIRTSW